MGCTSSTMPAVGRRRGAPDAKSAFATVATVDAVMIDDLKLDEAIGAFVKGMEPVVKEQTPKQFTTLLEAFQYADPASTGKLSDDKLWSEMSGILTETTRASSRESTSSDASHECQMKPVNFPAFAEWARSQGITLPLGVRGCKEDMFPFPPTWNGPRDVLSWNRRQLVQEDAHLAELQDLLNVSYKKTWTRDRKTTGINRVPDEFKLESALLNENFKDWCSYYAKKETVRNNCKTKPGFLPIEALTSGSESLHGRHQIKKSNDCNEWLLFHGTSKEAAKKICASGFRTDFAGTATGTLYGDGIYFSESITKADEYTKSDEDGVCCALVCRVVGGRVLYNSEKAPDGSHVKQCVQSGAADSVLGDRESTRNTFREFVTFNTDQVYVEYVLFYRRVFRDAPTAYCPTKPAEFVGFDVVDPAACDSKKSPHTPKSDGTTIPREDIIGRELLATPSRVPSIEERVKYFHRSNFLRDLKTDEKYELAKALIERKFKKGEYIFKEGEAADAFFIVYDGDISIQSKQDNSVRNYTCSIRTAGVHGVLALSEVRPSRSTLEAMTDIKTLSLDKASFEKLLGPMVAHEQVVLRQYDGHPAVRVFDEAERGARVIAELPNGTVMFVLQEEGDFTQVRSMEGHLEGWIGSKNTREEPPETRKMHAGHPEA